MVPELQQKKLPVIALIVVAFLEIAFQTFWMGDLGVYWQPVIYLCLALCFISLGLIFSLQDEVHQMSGQANRLKLLITAGVVLINGALLFSTSGDLMTIMGEIAIDPKNSDVLPAIQLYVQRIIAGEWAYAPMEFPGWTVIPNYLPLVWLPFLLPELMGIDYRWLPFSVFVVYGLFYWWRQYQTKDQNTWEYAVKSILPFFLLWVVMDKEPMVFGHTAELLIITFYLILCETVLSKKMAIAGLGILLCLLSRYSFGFWLPVYVLIYWWQFGLKSATAVIGYVFLGLFAIYIFPFVFEDPLVYKKGMDYYMYSAQGEWVPHGWQQADERPVHLGRGLGFAVYVYDFIKGDVVFKLKVIQMINAITSLMAAISIAGLYWHFRNRMRRPKLFLIFALKFYIMIFYSFLHVPYAYLYILPMLLWLPIISRISFAPVFAKERE